MSTVDIDTFVRQLFESMESKTKRSHTTDSEWLKTAVDAICVSSLISLDMSGLIRNTLIKHCQEYAREMG